MEFDDLQKKKNQIISGTQILIPLNVQINIWNIFLSIFIWGFVVRIF